MLRARLATAAVAIPLLLGLFLYGPFWAFTGFVAVIAMLGIGEHAAMAFPDAPGTRAVALGAGALIVVAVLSGRPDSVVAALLVVLFSLCTWVLLVAPDFREGYRDVGWMLPGVLSVGLFLPHFALLQQVPDEGRYLAVFTVAVGMAGDSSGYFVGRELGRHKLIPGVSPGKTIEGSLGIVAGSIAAALLCRWWILPTWGWMEIALVATVMSVLGQIGDLSVSVVKRTFGAKESGWLFPGHGGVLDRIDSLLFPVAFLYYYVSLLR